MPDEQQAIRRLDAAAHPFDLLYPFAGPCMVCGGPDKRHRLADAIVSNVRGGDAPRLVAEAYGVKESTVRALVAHVDRNRTRHKARWSA
jgi:hypothetical protein